MVSSRAGSHRPALSEPSSTIGCFSSVEACGQAAEELAAADRVQDQDGECGEHDGGDHGGYVDTVLALECPQGEGEGPPVGALGEDQGQQEAVADGQCVV